MKNSYNFVVADISQMSIWNIAKTQEEAEQHLIKANISLKKDIELYKKHIVNYPDMVEYWQNQLHNANEVQYQIMTYDDFKKIEREHLLSGNVEEINEEDFEEMLNVLPPLKWCTIDNIEMFCMSEMWTGSYTSQYAHDKTTDKYYTKMVDYLDSKTWINEILKGKSN